MKPPGVREQVALHEAGHAVAHVMLGVPFEFVTIEPTPDALGRVQGLGGPIPAATNARLALAGPAANLAFGMSDLTAGSALGWGVDLADARRGRTNVTLGQMLLEVRPWEPAIRRVADALLVDHTLSYERVRSLV